MKTCPFCAEEIQDAAIVCKHCGRELTTGVAKPSGVSGTELLEAQLLVEKSKEKSPGFAAILGFFFPALAAFYTGRFLAGVVFLLIDVVNLALAVVGIGVVTGLLFRLFAAFLAYSWAGETNRKSLERIVVRSKTAARTPVSGPVSVTVNVARANLRSQPDRSAAVFRAVKRGARYDGAEDLGEWFRVPLPNGQSGYLSAAVVRIAGAADAAQPKPKQSSALPLAIAAGLVVVIGAGILTRFTSPLVPGNAPAQPTAQTAKPPSATTPSAKAEPDEPCTADGNSDNAKTSAQNFCDGGFFTSVSVKGEPTAVGVTAVLSRKGWSMWNAGHEGFLLQFRANANRVVEQAHLSFVLGVFSPGGKTLVGGCYRKVTDADATCR